MNEIAFRLASRLFDKPIIENQYRSAFVEAMIEPCLSENRWRYTGDSWCGWDFQRADGARLEVKQSAAVQPWSEARNIATKGAFDIASRTGYFSENGAKWSAIPGRPADVYVFAWNPESDHRDPDNWVFFVVPTAVLPAQKTISLSKIRGLAERSGQSEPLKLSQLAVRVVEVLGESVPARIDSTPLPA